MSKKYIYGGKPLTLKQLNNEFNNMDKDIINYYKEIRNKNEGGGFLSRMGLKRGKNSDLNEKKYIIKTLPELKEMIDDLRTKQRLIDHRSMHGTAKQHSVDIDDYNKKILAYQHVLEQIKNSNIKAFKYHDKMYEYRDQYNNIWRFSGIVIASLSISGSVSFGTAPIAITILALAISWFYSKYSTYNEMQKMLIIVLCNTLHMKRNIKKLIDIYKVKQNIDDNTKIDIFLEKEISPLFRTLVKQIEDFVEALFNLAGDGAAEQFILYLEYYKITEHDSDFENINIDELISKQNKKFYKAKQFIKFLKNAFTINDKYRIMLREANICLSMFTLLISDVLIYAINENDNGKHVELSNTHINEVAEIFNSVSHDDKMEEIKEEEEEEINLSKDPGITDQSSKSSKTSKTSKK
jgi:hypothetical protein